jgi:hypothetical protein
MIISENRLPLFGIMLQPRYFRPEFSDPDIAVLAP